MVLLGIVSCCCISCALSVIAVIALKSPKQVDLGIDSSDAVAEAYFSRVGFEQTFLDATEPVKGEPVYTGKLSVNESLSDAEITSVMKTWGKWESTPFSNAQVRINDDGSAEFSALVDIGKAKEFAKILGYSDEEISTAENYTSFLGDSVPVYAKGTASMSDNAVSLDLTAGKIANFSVPAPIIDQLELVVEEAIEKRLSLIPSANIRSVTFDGGNMFVDADFPQKVDIK